MNLVLLVAFMSLMGATLTLPGIAGIVLTVGMAVDANVLIFSRIREELAAVADTGAISSGYDRAFVSILDANVTTLIVALILFLIGSGPVQGFAVTLSIGILTSMFTAILLTRSLVNLTVGGRKSKSSGFRERIMTHQMYNLMGIRKIAVVFSAIMLVASIASLSINGLVLGLDFSGGTQVEVGYEQPADVAELRQKLESAGFEGPVVHYGSETDVLIHRRASRMGLAEGLRRSAKWR